MREYCLKYGASIFFTDTTHSLTNIELLYKYIVHRIYDYDFPYPSKLDEKNSLFIPTGRDTLNLIAELCKGVNDGIPYEEVIKKPTK